MIVERREENLFNSLIFTIIQRAIPLLSLCANTKKTPTKKREVLSNFSSRTRSRSKVATKVASSRGHLFGVDRRSSNKLLMSAQPQIKVSIAAAVNSLAKRKGVASVWLWRGEREIYLTRSSSQSYKEQFIALALRQHKKTPTKKEKSFRTSLLVPYDILFSNEYLRDLGRIWELREIVPDPNNMPWIEKIDK